MEGNRDSRLALHSTDRQNHVLSSRRQEPGGDARVDLHQSWISRRRTRIEQRGCVSANSQTDGSCALSATRGIQRYHRSAQRRISDRINAAVCVCEAVEDTRRGGNYRKRGACDEYPIHHYSERGGRAGRQRRWGKAVDLTSIHIEHSRRAGIEPDLGRIRVESHSENSDNLTRRDSTRRERRRIHHRDLDGGTNHLGGNLRRQGADAIVSRVRDIHGSGEIHRETQRRI